MEPGHSLIAFAAAGHGVLSQIASQHPEHLAAADPPAFNQADDYPYVLDQQRVPPGAAAPGRPGSGRIGDWLGWAILARPTLIEVALLALSFGLAVESGTALPRSLLAVGLPATEGTAQVVPTGIARVGQEENAAVPAPGQAGAQVRLGVQDRSQQHIIFLHQHGHRAGAIPIRPKLKMLRDPNCKKPKLSLRMLTLNDMSPSY
jgi:hypothetical protein